MHFDPMMKIGGAPGSASQPGAEACGQALADHVPEVLQTPTRPPRAARLKTTPVACRKLPPADALDGARAILFAPAAAAFPKGATSAHRPPLDPGSVGAAGKTRSEWRSKWGVFGWANGRHGARWLRKEKPRSQLGGPNH
jgi:hypothetical protein